MANFDDRAKRSPSPQKITVFGASGKTGKLVVEEALAQNYQVKAFVRASERLPMSHPHLTIVTGDAMDLEAVDRAIEGSDGVISVLGWSQDSPKNLLTRAGKTIIDVMEKQGVSRLITVIGAAVERPTDEPPSLSKRLIVFLIKKIEPELFADSQNLADAIGKSNLDWTIVRVPRLANGNRTKTYRSGQLNLGFGAKVQRADLAHFLVEQLADNKFIKEAPEIAS